MKKASSKDLAILLIEDNQDDIFLIQKALNAFPCKLHTLNDGQQGLDYLSNSRRNPDVVLLDYHIPSVDGIEFLRRVNAKESDIAFIFMTVDCDIQTVVKAMNAGALDFLQKTERYYEQLEEIIKRVLKQHKEHLDQKLIRQALRQYVDIVNNMQVGLYVFHVDKPGDDHSLRIVDANPAAEKQVALSSMNMIGCYIDEIWPELRQQSVPKIYLEVIKTEEPRTLEIIKNVGAENRPHSFAVKAFPLPNQHVGVLLEDTTQLKSVEDTVRRRDTVLEAVSFIARSLLRSDHFENDLYASLERLGWAIQCSRVYICKNNKDSIGASLYTPNSEWIKNGINHPVHINKYEQEFYLVDFGPTIKQHLENGKVYMMYRSELSKNQALFWEIQDITSFVLVPIFVNQSWWGFIGFDESDVERKWTAAEIDALKVAAETIGGAIQRQQAENLINASLKEKEALLQEIHHRVKNNLQIISSLLDMSTLRVKDPHAISLFADARDKIYSMALIHSQLYNSERFDQIQMKDHVQEIASYLITMHGGERRIKMVISVEEFHLPIAQAIPCTLILNEFVSNALKHAYKGRQEGELTIAMKKNENNTIDMIVKDNGVGVAENVDLFGSTNMGLKLVKNIVEKQLKGSISYTHKNGVCFHVDFKLAQEEKVNYP